jgi:cell wall-associated NlpC family hydrolase
MEKERIETTIASLETAREVLSVQTLDNLTTTDGGAKVTTTPTPAAPNTPALPIAPTIESTTPTATQTPLQLVAAPTEVTTEAAPVSVTQDVAPTTTPSYSSGAATSTSASSGASGALAAVEAALAQVGKSYGHENDGSEWDCNGLTNYAWQQAGVEIPYASGTYSYGQFQYMKESDNWVTSEDDLKAGDLVFFSQDGGNTTYHVGMYIGDGQIVHAVGYSEGVQVTDLDYVNGFVGGGTPE